MNGKALQQFSLAGNFLFLFLTAYVLGAKMKRRINKIRTEKKKINHDPLENVK